MTLSSSRPTRPGKERTPSGPVKKTGLPETWHSQVPEVQGPVSLFHVLRWCYADWDWFSTRPKVQHGA